ncbi:MAG: DUF1802 family protein [Akkermansiaceae bacterium]|nr:DUF1802 family protein [Akkermansiaceae bacterium]
MNPATGFKEWQVVCDALASGRQSILLRKGGIHEGRDGFSFAHDSFFLFPTRFHSQGDQVREGKVEVMPEWQPGDEIAITHHAEADWAVTLTNANELEALRNFHIYSDSTVQDRFDWEGKGMATGSIHVALVRVRKLAEPWRFPYGKQYGGCRSWVTLPDAPSLDLARPVIADEDYEVLKQQLEGIVMA